VAFAPSLPDPRAGGDASGASWVPVDEAGELPFDHAAILADGVERARAKLEYSGLATEFVDDEFTVAELRRVYEEVWSRALDPGNFQRKVTGVPGLLAETGRRTGGNRGRPAALYTAGGAEQIWPPMSRERDG